MQCGILLTASIKKISCTKKGDWICEIAFCKQDVAGYTIPEAAI
jgi:hypothetical protein